jgi:hypothetical protein
VNINTVSYLCIISLGWSLLGTWQVMDSWVGALRWWGLLGFVLVQLSLMGLILRTVGVRFLSVAFCVLVLAISWTAYLMFFVFSLWKFGGLYSDH